MIPPTCGIVVSRRLATLAELETVYTYGDAMIMADIIMVDNVNEAIAMEDARKEKGNGRR